MTPEDEPKSLVDILEVRVPFIIIFISIIVLVASELQRSPKTLEETPPVSIEPMYCSKESVVRLITYNTCYTQFYKDERKL